MAKKGENASRQALYRKYRSRSLDEVVGQSQVTDVLRRSLEQGKIAHAYLLTGPRGVGKTSIARILAHEINQLPYSGEATHLDIIEIDAASNNGVEDVRDLRDKVQLAPIAASKKVYIIDEVHMLSKPAFNALLKTLEEPPAHVVFILATTDLHKVPATIISRTQHFAFRSIGRADLAAHLKQIAAAEGMKITDEALTAIATRGDGSFRDSISLLDQLSSFADAKEGVTLELVRSTLGLPPQEAVEQLLAAVDAHDVAGVIALLDKLETQGVPPTILTDQIIQTVRGVLPERPQLVGLLDALLTVNNSPQPGLKLLTTLVGAIKPSAGPRTVAARAAKPPAKQQTTVIEAPVILVEAPREEPQTSSTQTTPASPTTTKPATPKTSKKRTPSKPFDWSALLEYVKEHSVALSSVLSKCDYELEGDTLTIYTVRKFNKTKIDQTKYLTQLHEALENVGQPNLTIITVPTAKPPADAQLAKVAAMMGGGEEVSLESMGESK